MEKENNSLNKSKDSKTETKNEHDHNTVRIAGTNFEMGDRYELLKQIGLGSYSVVCSCYDKKENRNVAIKKVTNAFDNLENARRIFREMKLLRFFNHDNIIPILHIPKPENKQNFNDVYMVTELMETDLHRVIYSRQELTDDHIQYFIFQILRGTLYINSAGVVHRDLRPANILANKNCDLRICDLGLDRAKLDDNDDSVQRLIKNPNLTVEYTDAMIYEDSKKEINEKIIARWYRAPEAILLPNDYTKAVDVWSIGCILAELLGRQPLFPGDNYLDQIQKIISVLGTPKEDDLSFTKNQNVVDFIGKLARRTTQSFSQMFPGANPMAIDILEKMLVFNPKKRYTVEQCLSHPYFEGLNDGEQDPVCEHLFDYSFDEGELTKEIMRAKIYEQSLKYNRNDDN